MRGFDRRQGGHRWGAADSQIVPGADVEAALEEVYVAQKALWSAVGRARQMGLSWKDIGDRLGLSAETVHHRYAMWVPIDEPPKALTRRLRRALYRRSVGSRRHLPRRLAPPD